MNLNNQQYVEAVMNNYNRRMIIDGLDHIYDRLDSSFVYFKKTSNGQIRKLTME